MSPIDTIVRALQSGVTMSLNGDQIALKSQGTPPRDLVAQIKLHKQALKQILSGRIMIVRSQLDPDHPAFWCGDEAARDLLIENGAEPGQVWVKEELAEIVSAQPDRDALSLIIAAKRELGGQITTRGGTRASEPEER